MAALSQDASMAQPAACYRNGIPAPNGRDVYNRAELEGIFLPAGQMLQLDRACEITADHVACEMDVRGHWAFPMHFPADPIFPGSLLIEAAGQTLAVWAWHAGFRGRPRLVKVSATFSNPVLPNDKVLTLVGHVRHRKFAFFGQVELFVEDRVIGQVNPVVILLTDGQSSSPGPERRF